MSLDRPSHGACLVVCYACDELRAHVLMRMFKQYERSVDVAVRAFFSDSLSPGQEITLGIEDDYAVSMELSWAIPAEIESKVVGFCSSIRQHALVDDV